LFIFKKCFRVSSVQKRVFLPPISAAMKRNQLARKHTISLPHCNLLVAFFGSCPSGCCLVPPLKKIKSHLFVRKKPLEQISAFG
jgi:hypothetical protein